MRWAARGAWWRGPPAAFTLTIFGFALSSSFPLSLLLLFLGGVASTVAGATIATLLQGQAPGRLRGRVMSLQTLAIIGMGPLGALISGALATVLPAPVAVAATAAVLLALLLWIVATQPAWQDVDAARRRRRGSARRPGRRRSPVGLRPPPGPAPPAGVPASSGSRSVAAGAPHRAPGAESRGARGPGRAGEDPAVAAGRGRQTQPPPRRRGPRCWRSGSSGPDRGFDAVAAEDEAGRPRRDGLGRPVRQHHDADARDRVRAAPPSVMS